MNRVALILTGLILTVVLFTAATLLSQELEWTPRTIARTVFASSVQAVTTSFTVSTEVTDARVWIVPELAPYVSASKTALGNLHAGETVSLTLLLSVPPDTPPGILEGTLHIVQSTIGATVARPLPITLIVAASGPEVQWVGPEGGFFGFPSGVVLDVPPGAVTEPVPIRIDPLPPAEVLEAILALPRLSSHRARLLGGFYGMPDGFQFQSPIRVTLPISPLLPGEIPMLGTFDLASRTFETAATNLLYFGDIPAVQMEVAHYSPRVAVGLLEKESCAEGPEGDACRESWEIEALCTNPATNANTRCEEQDQLQHACCFLYPPDRPAGCQCCREGTIEVVSEESDFSVGTCGIVTERMMVRFPNCGNAEETHQVFGQSKECPEDMTMTVDVQPATLTLATCESSALSATVSGVAPDGRTVLPPTSVNPLWDSTAEEFVLVDNFTNRVLGKKPTNEPVTVFGWVSRAPEVGGSSQVTVEDPIVIIQASDGRSVAPLRMDPGESVQLTADLGTLDYSTPPLERWTSRNPQIASVDQATGTVTAVAAGETSVRVGVTYGIGDCQNVVDATVAVEVLDVVVYEGTMTVIAAMTSESWPTLLCPSDVGPCNVSAPGDGWCSLLGYTCVWKAPPPTLSVRVRMVLQPDPNGFYDRVGSIRSENFELPLASADSNPSWLCFPSQPTFAEAGVAQLGDQLLGSSGGGTCRAVVQGTVTPTTASGSYTLQCAHSGISFAGCTPSERPWSSTSTVSGAFTASRLSNHGLPWH